MSPETQTLQGVAAALGAPFVMSLGLLLWEKHWIGSAVLLNATKCTIATVFFVSLVPMRVHVWKDGLGLNASQEAPVARMDMLLLSSFLGITIGDIVWLVALQRLGARKLILVDSIKPGVGACLAWALLGEEMNALAGVAILVTMAGVLVVALEPPQSRAPDDSTRSNLERQPQNSSGQTMPSVGGSSPSICPVCDAKLVRTDDAFCSECGQCRSSSHGFASQSAASAADPLKQPSDGAKHVFPCRDVKGYAFAGVNVVVDVLGAILTKLYGLPLGSLEINLVRFGSAAIMLDISLATIALVIMFCTRRPAVIRMEEPSIMSLTEETASLRLSRAVSGPAPRSWRSLPSWLQVPRMPPSDWALVAFGAILCTFITPVLSTTALFKIDVAWCMTLTSTGPVLSLPLAVVIKQERISVRAVLGAVLACVGVGLFANAL